MTLADLKTYLIQLAGAGVNVNQVNKIVDVALEAGYASVWGAYGWKFKRRSKSLTMTTGRGYSVLPSDNESAIDIAITTASNPRSIDLISEDVFRKDFPNPAAYSNTKPNWATIVYNGEPNDMWRVYWFRIPSSAFSYDYFYHKKADSADLPSLPSYMMDAIVAKASELMQTDAGRKASFAISANNALQRAIMSDKSISGSAIRWGGDPGWDDFSNVRRGGSVWDPFAL